MSRTKRFIVACSSSALCVLLLLPSVCWGQSASAPRQRYAGTKIPSRLQASLDDGLRRFVEAQANDDWNAVADLLGRFRGGARGVPFTQSHKECLLSQMRALPITSFITEQVSYSTEILSTPAGQRWWYLMGTAEFLTQAGVTKARTHLIAYLDRGRWYFTPPNYDDAWVRARVTEADLAADLSDNVEIQLDPNCPVEVRDLTVSMDRERLSLRRIRFSLVNKTGKKVKGYGLRLGRPDSPCFSLLSGQPKDIEPRGEVSGEEVTYSGYLFYCSGEVRQRLVIDSLSFADGTTWTDPRFRGKKPPMGCHF